MANMLAWFSFPAEIRLMILEFLAREKHGLASYASVCREWVEVIEKKNFGRLKLGEPCLDDLEHMVSRRRGLVKHIWLNIELRRYTCRCCDMEESRPWTSSNNAIITRAISKLFGILATWKASSGSGLTLELSAQSPSDNQHWFKHFYFGSESTNDDEDGYAASILDSQNDGLHEHTNYPYHDLIDGRQVVNPSGFAVLRLFERVGLNFKVELPTVPVVTKLVLRRQCRRRFDGKALGVRLEKLPRLECLVYEPWRGWPGVKQRRYDEGYRAMIEEHLPKGLNRLSVFEDYSDDLIRLFRDRELHGRVERVRTPEPKVGKAFAYRSLSLEHLSVSFMADAQHFFEARKPRWKWNRLRSLMLTSRLLTPTADPRRVCDLLENAGVAALYMPELRNMTLWNGERGLACAFLYRRDMDRPPSIVWRGTWVVDMEPRVIQAWERAAAEHAGARCTLRVETQALCCDCGTIGSHGDAIHHLDLPREVVDPT